MNAKNYKAATMAEALAAVKGDLGRDAVILRTRRCRIGGWMGIGSRRAWEITAAPHSGLLPPLTGVYASDAPAPAGRLDGQIAEIKILVEQLARRPASAAVQRPMVLQKLHDHLLAQDVEAALAAELIDQTARDLTGQQMQDESAVRTELRKRIAARIRTAPLAESAAGPRVIAFVGPTGVGKTTTIAKLAANFKIAQHKSVSLITIDTYRIAAVDQLKTYADIIEVPIQAVLSPTEMRRTIKAATAADVILIDTTGRSPGDQLRLGQLRSFLDAAEADEVHLVASATGNQAATRRAVEKFAGIGANRLTLTKLDEAVTYGLVLNMIEASKAPLSYTTFGQEVPDDIAPAKADRLAQMILGEVVS
ncbi:MAG: 50S ribosome-binding GTPase [Planctomycetaceae bacterium]|nr:50S ribosome-binding GTPase [Planctomycetaceae bacterium]